MTELLFQVDSYLKECRARVTTVFPEENAVVLDRTTFYAGGGGQPADVGHIRFQGKIYPVKKVQKQGSDVFHFIDGELPPLNSDVLAVIDWDRRYRLMRTHTALHILCGVVWRDYGAQVTGGNMEPLRGRMDFEFESLRADLVKEIENKVNIEVESGRQVNVKILPREEAFKIPDLIRTKINLLPPSLKEVRTVEIEGLDLQADGGTHVANTKEVGRIQIAGYKSKGRINKRIEIELIQ